MFSSAAANNWNFWRISAVNLQSRYRWHGILRILPVWQTLYCGTNFQLWLMDLYFPTSCNIGGIIEFTVSVYPVWFENVAAIFSDPACKLHLKHWLAVTLESSTFIAEVVPSGCVSNSSGTDVNSRTIYSDACNLVGTISSNKTCFINSSCSQDRYGVQFTSFAIRIAPNRFP